MATLPQNTMPQRQGRARAKAIQLHLPFWTTHWTMAIETVTEPQPRTRIRPATPTPGKVMAQAIGTPGNVMAQAPGTLGKAVPTVLRVGLLRAGLLGSPAVAVTIYV